MNRETYGIRWIVSELAIETYRYLFVLYHRMLQQAGTILGNRLLTDKKLQIYHRAENKLFARTVSNGRTCV